MRTSAVILTAGDGLAFQIREGYFRSGEQRDPAAGGRRQDRCGSKARRDRPCRAGRPKIGSGKRTEPQTSGDGAGDGVIPLKCRPELPVVTRSGLQGLSSPAPDLVPLRPPIHGDLALSFRRSLASGKLLRAIKSNIRFWKICSSRNGRANAKRKRCRFSNGYALQRRRFARRANHRAVLRPCPVLQAKIFRFRRRAKHL